MHAVDCMKNARHKIFRHVSGSLLGQNSVTVCKWSRNIVTSIKHNTFSMNHAIWNSVDFGSALACHLIIAPLLRSAVTRWHARLAQNPENPKWCVSYVSNLCFIDVPTFLDYPFSRQRMRPVHRFLDKISDRLGDITGRSFL